MKKIVLNLIVILMTSINFLSCAYERVHAGCEDNNQNTGKTSKFTRPGNFEWQSPKKNPVSSFEEMLSSFNHKSEEKISDLKRATESKRGSFSRRGSQR